MKAILESFQLIAKRKDSRLVIIFSTALLMLVLLIAQNGKEAFSLFGFDSLPLFKRIILFFTTLFNIQDTFTTGTFILVVLGSFVGGINLAMAYTYMKIRGEIILKSGAYTGLSLFVAFLGVGCAACGTALLGVIFGFFGFSTMLNVLPYEGQEIGYIGLIFLCLATYMLSKKVAAPLVC